MINRSLSITEYSSLCANSISSHNCVALVNYTGEIAQDVFIKTLNYLAAIYPCLTVKLKVEQNNIRIISDSVSIPFRQIEISNICEIQKYFESEINAPFNLNNSPLIRVTNLYHKDHNHLILTLHHLISDGISISYFVGKFFETIECILLNNRILLDCYKYRRIEDVLSILVEPSTSFYNNFQNFLFPKEVEDPNLKTNIINFTIPKPQNTDINLNSLILTASGISIANDDPIKYFIPVNMRKFSQSKISNYELGFHSSWIEFDFLVENVDNGVITKKFENSILDQLSSNNHFINLKKLQNIKNVNSTGIISDLHYSSLPTVCVSNVGRVQINTSYANKKIIINSLNLGLYSYLNSKNSFLLIATGLEEKMHFTFLYSLSCMNKHKAHYTVDLIKKFFKAFA